MIDLLYLAFWAEVAWVSGDAALDEPGPYGLSAWARALWPAGNPNAWWVFPAITLVAACLVASYIATIWQNTVGGVHAGVDGVLRDGAGYPIGRLGPFIWRRG